MKPRVLVLLGLMALAPSLAFSQTYNIGGPSTITGPTVPVVCPNPSTGVMASCASGGGGGGNAAASATGAAVPSSADYQGLNVAGILTGWIGDSSGRGIVVGAGVAGTPAGGVLSIQGVGSGTAIPVSGTFFQATQPISAASLPLPTGAMGSTGGTVGLVAGAAVIGHVINDASSAVIGHVIVDTAPTTAVTIATAPVLVAGSAIIGKVGIDQTTPGTTNGVQDASTGSTGSAAPAKASYAGAVSSGNLTGIIQGDTSANINVTTATTTQLIALSGTTKTYITALRVLANGADTVTFEYGTGSSCGTGTTVLDGPYNLPANGGVNTGGGLGPVLVIPAGKAFCVLTSAATALGGSLTYTQF